MHLSQILICDSEGADCLSKTTFANEANKPTLSKDFNAISSQQLGISRAKEVRLYRL